MKTKSAYEEALQRPISKNIGWKYADDESMQAATAQMLAQRHCLNPENVFNWAKKHDVDLCKNPALLYKFNDVLLVAVLNDYDLEKAIKELKII
jgi:hypothetical protein